MKIKAFANYIGQTLAVRILMAFCQAIAEARLVPLQPITMTGEAGNGKSHLADTYALALNEAKNAEREEDKFHCVEFNGSTLTVQQLLKYLVTTEGKPRFIKIDEAAGIRPPVRNFIKMFIETNNQIKTFKDMAEYPITANPFQDQWIFCSNENLRDKALFGPTGRTMVIPLTHYTPKEVKAIIVQRIESYYKGQLKIDDKALEFLITRVFPNGRAIKTLVDCELLTEGGVINEKKAQELCLRYQRFPMGLGRSDIAVLRFLSSNDKGWQVQDIAAHLGENSGEVAYRVGCLSGYKMAFTHTGRKMITPMGIAYLAKLDAAKASAKAKKKAATTAETVSA
jgi:hypothetical protein